MEVNRLLEEAKKILTKVMKEIAEEVSSQLGKEKISIYFEDAIPPRNTKLNLVLNLRHNDCPDMDIEGVALVISFYTYNPRIAKYINYDDKLFVDMHLSITAGKYLSLNDVLEIYLGSNHLESEFSETVEKSVVYLKSQIPMIIKVLKMQSQPPPTSARL